MNHDDLYAMTLERVRDPDLAVPLEDALEDRGLRWGSWLDHSGILVRLAQCMRCALALRPSEAERRELQRFIQRTGVMPAERPYVILPGYYGELCRGLGVPPVLVETGVSTYRDLVPWERPSSELALAALRFALTQPLELFVDKEPQRWSRAELWDDVVYPLCPEATHYRLRLGVSRWVDRTRLAVPEQLAGVDSEIWVYHEGEDGDEDWSNG